MTNRLVHSTSPYLQQHADNPVDWREWGPDALTEARERDVPIFLSIGYAACHWCHVMAHESFSDPQVAELINSTSVPIKVDREERPDLDAVYMTATVAMTGQGGWPMSVWLTPEERPFHAGTYFPPEPRHGMPSFTDVLTAVDETWRQRREEVRTGAADIATQLADRAGVPPAGDVGPEEVDAAVLTLTGQYDPERGGFGGAPKFPPSMVLDALLARASQGDGEVADRAWQMAHDTCRAMADGGIHDQLAGGFARYSTDRAWVVPHFEKMLYDNAVLLGVYGRASLEAERRGEDPGRFVEVVERLVDWMIADLLTPEGGFASALDADSDDGDGRSVEGAYYVWTPDQLEAVLGAEAGRRAAAAYRVTASGTFEHGTSVLQRDPAQPSDDAVRLRLLHARDGRPRPARDDKVVTAWNGWAVASLAEVAMINNRPDWLAVAVRAAEFLLELHLGIDGSLARTSRRGRRSEATGVAEDYAALGHGCAVLAQSTGEHRWLDRAVMLLDTLHDRFGADDGGLHDTARDAEQLYLRPREVAENASPSATTAALRADRMLYRLTGDERWRQRADALVATVGLVVARAPRADGWALHDAITEHGARPAAEVAIVAGSAQPTEMITAAWRGAPPGSVIVTGHSAPSEGRDGEGPVASRGRLPLLQGRSALDDLPTAHVCHHQVCRRPVTTIEALLAELA